LEEELIRLIEDQANQQEDEEQYEDWLHSSLHRLVSQMTALCSLSLNSVKKMYGTSVLIKNCRRYQLRQAFFHGCGCQVRHQQKRGVRKKLFSYLFCRHKFHKNCKLFYF
jgi:hypothetical protein